MRKKEIIYQEVLRKFQNTIQSIDTIDTKLSYLFAGKIAVLGFTVSSIEFITVLDLIGLSLIFVGLIIILMKGFKIQMYALGLRYDVMNFMPDEEIQNKYIEKLNKLDRENRTTLDKKADAFTWSSWFLLFGLISIIMSKIIEIQIYVI